MKLDFKKIRKACKNPVGRRILRALMEKGAMDWNELFDLAAIGHIPTQLLAGPKVGDRLTVFFRAARGENAPSPKQFKAMIDAVKGEGSWAKNEAPAKTAPEGHKSKKGK